MERASRTRYAILGFLTWRPMSGYDIKRAIEQSTANFWSESYGQIYPILHRLVDLGLARPAEAPVGGRGRQRFAITPQGRRELRRWLEAPTEAVPVRNETLLKLFFGRYAGTAAHGRELSRLRREAERVADHLRGLRTLIEAHSETPDAPYWLITLRFGEIQAEAQIRWLDEALAFFADSTPATESGRATGRGPRPDTAGRGARTPAARTGHQTPRRSRP